MAPWRVLAGVVVRYFAKLFGLSRDDVLETLDAMGALARQCKIFYTHISRRELNEDARVRRAYATIHNEIEPAIEPCGGSVCPVCTALTSLPAASATGLAPSVTSPTLPSSSAAQATGLAAPPPGLAAPPPGLAPPRGLAPSVMGPTLAQSTGGAQKRKFWNTLDLVNGSPRRTNSCGHRPRG